MRDGQHLYRDNISFCIKNIGLCRTNNLPVTPLQHPGATTLASYNRRLHLIGKGLSP